MAGLSKAKFHQLLGEREVERHYTEADLALNTCVSGVAPYVAFGTI
jgi:hypothetical protein